MDNASSNRGAQRPRLRSILPADLYSALVRPDRASPPSDPPNFPADAEPSPEPIASLDAPSATAPKKKRRKTLNAFIFFSQHVRQRLPKEHQDKFRLRFDFTRFASCLWNRLSEETVEEWYARRDTAEDRCREETGHDLVGNGTDYLVNVTWRELVPEDVEKAAIYAFDHPDPAEVAKKQERKERKRKRQEERSAAAQRARECDDQHPDCVPSHRRKKRRLASPATSLTLSSPDNTPSPPTPPAYLPSAPLSQYTIEGCVGLPQTPLPYIQHPYANGAYPSEFAYEDTIMLPHVNPQSQTAPLSPVPESEPHAIPQAEDAYYCPTRDDHAFGSPNFDYEFTFALESLATHLGTGVCTDDVMDSHPVGTTHCSSTQPLAICEPQAPPAANSMSHLHGLDTLYPSSLDAPVAVASASDSAQSYDGRWFTVDALCGQGSMLDGSQTYDIYRATSVDGGLN